MIAVVVAAPEASLGASFDCHHATSSSEQLICGNSRLSDLDGRLGKLYQERSAALSESGAIRLRDSQRNWLHFVAVVCDVPKEAATKWDNSASCMERRYSERLQDLAKVGVRIGPYVFNRVDAYTSKPAPERDFGSVPGFNFQHVAFPQIDTPVSAGTETWNRRAEKSLPIQTYCAGFGDDEIDYDVKYVNHEVISVLWSMSSYCHGTPHGMYGLRSDNTVIAPTLRPLSERDIFGSTTDLSVGLKQLLEKALHESGWTPPGDQDWKNIVEDMMQSRNWVLTQDGLQINFGDSAGGCYACDPPPITVRWADLKPLQKQGALVP